MKNSLKLKLFIIISLFSTIILLAVGTMSFVAAKREIKEVFDADMAQSAKLILKIAKHNPNQNFLADEFDDVQNKFFHKFEKKIHLQVWKKEKLIHDSDKGFIVAKPEREGYDNLIIADKKWRQFSLFDKKSNLTILILEDGEIRQELVLEILKAFFIPFILAFPLILLAVYLAIKTLFQPIRLLIREIEKLSAKTLIPFKKKNLPSEIRPLVNSLNTMISRLEEAMEAERRFTNYAAHELRTPIAAIKTQAQLILRNKNQEKADEYMQDLILAVDRMTHLVDQILILSRLEPENKDFDKEQIDLLELSKKIIAQHKAEIEINCDKNPVIFGNKIYIEIMLNNLLDNALKYRDEGSLIKIDLEQKKFSISNFGKKISDDEIEKLFNKFYRGKNTDVIGCGLGLAIVKKIAELHDMKVSFTSDAGENIITLSF